MVPSVFRARRSKWFNASRRLCLLVSSLALCAVSISVLPAQSFPRPRPDEIPASANSPWWNFGSENVGSTSSAVAVSFQVFAGVTISSIQVVDQGQAGLEFNAVANDTSPSVCKVGAYASATTCVVDVTFSPSAPGQRLGAVILTASGGWRAVTYLSGTGIAPQAMVGYNRTGTELATYRTSLNGIPKLGGAEVSVVDAKGNIFFGDYSDQVLYELTRTGPGTYTGTAVTLSGVPFPQQVFFALAIDGAGNLFTTDGSNVFKISNGVVSTVNLQGQTLGYAHGLATDSAGNLYIADSGKGDILVVPPPLHGSVTVLAGVPSGDMPEAVAVDESGTVYYYEYNSYSIKKVVNGAVSTVGTYQKNGTVSAINFDANGNLLFGDSYAGGLYSMNPATGKLNSIPVSSPCGTASFVYTPQGDFVSSSDACGDVVLYQAYSTGSLTPFATTNVGKTSSDSPQSVTLYNMGNADLTLAAPASGSNPAVTSSFAVDSASTCPQASAGGKAGTLAAGSSCMLGVDFIPVTSGSITGTVTLTDNSLNTVGTTQTISVSGQAIQPIPTVTLSASPTSVLAGGMVALQATVTGANGTPTGSVTFHDGTTALGTVPLNGGVASFNATFTTVGTHSITANYGGDTTYIAGVSSAVQVQVEDFGFGLPGSTTTTILPGQTATFSFTVNPLGGPTFAQDVSLTLSGVPNGISAQLTPATVSAGSGATTVQLQLVASKSMLISRADRDPLGAAGRIAFGLLLLPLFGFGKVRRRAGRWLVLLVLLAGSLAATLGLSGCGTASGYFGQKQVSATVTLTGTSGSTTHTTSFTLNVE
ncbi:MAG: Ig-like domain repeat protein [Acidobacteriota bacterium]